MSKRPCRTLARTGKNSRLRVLQLGSGNLFGGIEVCQRTTAKFRDTYPDMEQEYAFCFSGKAANDLRDTGVTVHLLSAVRYSRPWTVRAARKALMKLLTDQTYTAVVCHELWVYGIVAPVVRRFAIPLVLWLHDRHSTGGVFEYLARRTPPDMVLCNSFWSAATLPEFLPGVPFHVLYCPVEPDLPCPHISRNDLRQRFHTPLDSLVILQVGRWEPHKGHMCHLKALADLQGIPSWVCWQVGAPQRYSEQHYFNEVSSLATQLGIADRIRFLGWQPDLQAVRASADIYCQPNTRPEPFGLTLVEALSAGLPLIASHEAGPREIVTADCGILVTPDNILDLANALRSLLNDSGFRYRLGKHGPVRAKALCDPAQQVTRLANLISEVGILPNEMLRGN